MTLTWRTATLEDLDQILAIEEDSFATPWHEETFRSLCTREGVDLIVALSDDQIVGYAVLWSTVDEGELANIAVKATHRGRGVGGELMGRVVEAAMGRGVRRLFLEVRQSNEFAAKLYQRYEFHEIGVRRGYYQNPIEDARVLVKELTSYETDYGADT